MTIGTAPLTVEATWHELRALAEFLAMLGIEHVTINYGWGCQPVGGDQSVTTPLAQLLEVLQNNIAQGIYHLGDDNLYISTSNPTLKITLCHDADIHFDANPALEARLRAEWQGRGHRVWPSIKRS